MILKNHILFNNIVYLDETDSTNSYLRRQVLEDRPRSGCVVCAKTQTNGRGRKNRIWTSVPDASLTFSFLLDLTGKKLTEIATITLAAGVGVSAALNGLGIDCKLKWPNDIYADNKKLCGILSETVTAGENIYAICGVGINVNLDNKALETIGCPATSIYAQTAVYYSFQEVLTVVLRHLDIWLAQWFACGIEVISHQWMKTAYGLGKSVQIIEDGKIIEEGFFVGIGSLGQFLLRKFDGSIKEVWAADVVWIK